MERLTGLLVDDYSLYRGGLLANLLNDEIFGFLAEASNGIEAIEKARALRPDVVLMDLNMPRCNGVEATRQIMKETPDARILILTTSDSDNDLYDALEAGARGYALKTETPDRTIEAIHCVAKGGLYFSSSVGEALLDRLRNRELSANGVPTGRSEADSTKDYSPSVPVAQMQAPTRDNQTDVRIAQESVLKIEKVPFEVRVLRPFQMDDVLKLYRWLQETPQLSVGEITPLFSGDLVITVVNEVRDSTEPLPFLPMLASLPYVTGVKEQPGSQGEDRLIGLNNPEPAEHPQPEVKRICLSLSNG